MPPKKKNRGNNKNKNNKKNQQQKTQPPSESSAEGLARLHANYPWNIEAIREILLQKPENDDINVPEPKKPKNDEDFNELKRLLDLPESLDLLELHEESNAVKFLYGLMDRFIRIDIDDGRTLTGILKSIDRRCNIILADTVEYWKNDEDKLDGTSFHNKRNTGLIMVPGKYIKSVMLISYKYPNEESETFFTKPPDYIEKKERIFYARKKQQDAADEERTTEYRKILQEEEERHKKGIETPGSTNYSSIKEESDLEEIDIPITVKDVQAESPVDNPQLQADLEMEKEGRKLQTAPLIVQQLSKYTSYLPADHLSWNRKREVLATEENTVFAKKINQRIIAAGGYRPVQRGGITSGRPIQRPGQ